MNFEQWVTPQLNETELTILLAYTKPGNPCGYDGYFPYRKREALQKLQLTEGQYMAIIARLDDLAVTFEIKVFTGEIDWR